MSTARVLPASFALLFAMMAAAPAHADDYSSLFEQRYASPEDVGVLGQFVSKAVEVGQYDQAISTLEQHLVRYPRDARAKYSLAKLYANTGSWELAKRNAEDALEIGDLTAEEAADAQRLVARANNSLAGFEWALDTTVGIKSTWLDVDETEPFDPTPEWRDRQDWNPFFAGRGSLRIDLDTPMDDALIVSGGALFERRYEDIYQGTFFTPPDEVYLHHRGYASVVLDKGIETTALDALRFQFGVYGNWKTYNPNVRDAELGTLVRFIMQPAVDVSAFVEGRYGSLKPAEGLVGDHRFQAAAGVTKRLSHEHSVGIAGRYIHEIMGDGSDVTKQREVEVSYAGLVPHQPFDTVWTQQVTATFGDFETIGPFNFGAPVTDGRFLKASWVHTFQIDGYNSVAVGYEFYRKDFAREFLFFDSDFTTHAVSISYTKTF